MIPATIRAPHGMEMPAVFAVLAEYRVHLLGAAPLADADFPPDALLAVRNTIVDVDLDARALVAVEEGRVVGFCCWDWLDHDARAARTVLITVQRSRRGSGIGAALQRARMEAMWAAGAETIHTWSDDPSAIAWYERHFGYEAVGDEAIRHALHRFRLGDSTWWALHRGFPERGSLTHLVARRHAEVHA
ncbi:MAG TPA: GNAT family N-acetyltransferase [Gemmatimonadales bacterium]|jgi:predicted N-acetyltransferase YhbS|nr:GNAT family N-acetyltransferase [Gemmatimonadales bacterium]